MPSVSTSWLATSGTNIGRKGTNAACSTVGPEGFPEDGHKVERHRDYFFADGNVVLQIEDIQYKLHRSVLAKHSPVFQELFTLPQPEGSTEGCTEDNPIYLSGIQADDFTRFIGLLYPPTLGCCNVTTATEWLSVLDQADRWQVESLREHAVTQLNSMYIEPVQKIAIWLRYGLPTDPLIPSYIDVISRPRPLGLAQAQLLGLPLFVKISQARDLVHAKGACRCCGGVSAQTGNSIRRDRILEEIVHDVIGATRSPSLRY
ncbi:hypothetical protein C2E23DRAFT_821700 [Lenzites betulinus]|nr:hypothetical protein C2E23DRAFT_821700 [Lenzites betulinus]